MRPAALAVAVTLALCLLVNACSVVSPPPSTPKPWLPPLAPAALGQSLAALQRVSGERDGETYVLLFQLEVEPGRLAMVASTPGGNSLFSLDYRDGAVIVDSSPLLPAALDPAFVLADFQLTYWPLVAVREALAGSDYRVLQSGDRRELWRGDEVLARVDYSGVDPWSGPVEFRNLRWSYGYRIDTLNTEPLTPAAGPVSRAGGAPRP